MDNSLVTLANSECAMAAAVNGSPVLLRNNHNGSIPNGSDAESNLKSRIECDDLFPLEELELTTRRRSSSIIDVTNHAQRRLSEELKSAREELKLRDNEVKRLEQLHDVMNTELEELTAVLFEEANKSVQDAHVRRMKTEKLLKESNAKIEVLEAEVIALKTLVITSTPSMPNKHLHPQLEGVKVEQVKGHKRSTSHQNLISAVKGAQDAVTALPRNSEAPQQNGGAHAKIPSDPKQVDPAFFEQFQRWRKEPRLNDSSPFMSRIVSEDILPCLKFTDAELSQSVWKSVTNNTLIIEPVIGEDNLTPRVCALSKVLNSCKYRLQLYDKAPCQPICQLARSRITAVCDFCTYVRYIQQGLVKSDEASVYNEIVGHRKIMNLARLGLSS